MNEIIVQVACRECGIEWGVIVDKYRKEYDNIKGLCGHCRKSQPTKKTPNDYRKNFIDFKLFEESQSLVICKANPKEVEMDEYNRVVNILYAYKVEVGEDGHLKLILMGRWDEQV